MIIIQVTLIHSILCNSCGNSLNIFMMNQFNFFLNEICTQFIQLTLLMPKLPSTNAPECKKL